MRLSFFVALGALAASVVAVPAPSSYAVHEKRDIAASSSQWKRRDVKLDRRTTTIPMSIALTQRNLEGGYSYLMDVSNPKSASYGKHWSAEEVAETFCASNETITSVTSWLVAEGISEERITISKGRNWIKFEATVVEVEYLLKTEYSVYESTDGVYRRSLVADEYSIPLAVRDHIDFISPTVQFEAGIPKRSIKKRAATGIEKSVVRAKTGPKYGKFAPYPTNSTNSSIPTNGTAPFNPTDLSICDSQITTECLRALYNIPNGTLSNSSLMIVEFSPQSYIPADLTTFLSVVDPWIPSDTQPIVDFVDGASLVEASGDNSESNLDLQLAIPLVYPQEVTYVQVGDNVQSGDFNTFLDAIDGSYCTSGGGDDTRVDPIYPDTLPGGYNGHDCGTIEPGAVISISYSADESQFTSAYLMRQCNEYMKLGLQGVSVLYSSGDYGAEGNKGICCVNQGCAGGDLQNGTLGGFFNPLFAGTCPYVTAVGATQINLGSTVNDPESATDFSGGGFSNVFTAPDYQQAAVDNYLTNYAPVFSPTQFKSNGRGYPDISANGNNILVYEEGAQEFLMGTSASTPIVASLFTLINNQLLAAGKPVIGFANPVLYAHPEAMNDIVTGSAPACGTEGFAAVKGWDPITGLGTPDYVRLLDVFLNL